MSVKVFVCESMELNAHLCSHPSDGFAKRHHQPSFDLLFTFPECFHGICREPLLQIVGARCQVIAVFRRHRACGLFFESCSFSVAGGAIFAPICTVFPEPQPLFSSQLFATVECGTFRSCRTCELFISPLSLPLLLLPTFAKRRTVQWSAYSTSHNHSATVGCVTFAAEHEVEARGEIARNQHATPERDTEAFRTTWFDNELCPVGREQDTIGIDEVPFGQTLRNEFGSIDCVHVALALFIAGPAAAHQVRHRVITIQHAR